eukprot:CAMPEP_0206001172 /NCGR_PEP_ID=MMETSP1464-20131121/1944_1 /ASSEMBLY_ACC=CAM_ASM_001124 /TAXON_ID=119497 /ORGANISM="Exanthemachrysis gayraliae, Strain RCC1523" /LENGTH=94 /DNA_ID=CAMNT_0053374461 /DNA_START=31 /DNA_END=311 /DNA_ORIENTATION=+
MSALSTNAAGQAGVGRHAIVGLSACARVRRQHDMWADRACRPRPSAGGPSEVGAAASRTARMSHSGPAARAHLKPGPRRDPPIHRPPPSPAAPA